jgi:hypothetical protein
VKAAVQALALHGIHMPQDAHCRSARSLFTELMWRRAKLPTTGYMVRVNYRGVYLFKLSKGLQCRSKTTKSHITWTAERWRFCNHLSLCCAVQVTWHGR